MISLPSTHRWYTAPLTVDGLTAGADGVPVNTGIDFTALLAGYGQSAAIDERAIRLYRIDAQGREYDEPVQFSADDQPRCPQRKLAPGTPPTVSWVAEWPAGETAVAPRVAGRLAWAARTGVRYQLCFGVRCNGKYVQVPFPPENLRCFDDEGRPTPAPCFPTMQLAPPWPLDGVVNALRQGALLTAIHTGPLREPDEPMRGPRRPYLYPVIGPDGIGLTDLGKPHDPTGSHAHHYSIWVAHADIAGVDFWSERGGAICHVGFDRMEDGPLYARLAQQTRWVFAGKTYLREWRTLTFHAARDDYRLIDVALKFAAPGDAPVTLGETPFGFLAARVAQTMTVFDGGGEIRNAQGQINEHGAHRQPSPWMDQSGPIAPGRWGGVTLFAHPENPDYPAHWHCRNDGWAGASFNMQRSWSIAPDAPLSLSYRILLHRHNAVEGEVARRYAEYAAPSVVRIGAVQASPPEL